MNRHDKRESTGHWVNCPECNKRIIKAKVTSCDCVCGCGAVFTAYVTKEFVTTIMHEKGDDLSAAERLERYHHQLLQLAD